VIRPLIAAVAVVGLAVAGCQGSQPSGPAAAVKQVGSLTVKLKAEGDELMLQQEYDKASVKYQAALNEAPGDIPIRFALATALSYLPRRDETVEQFRVVMQRATPGSTEARAAREWLANAGELGEGEAGPAPAGVTAAAPVPSNQGPPTAAAVKKGKVLGKINWQGIEPKAKMVRVNISLTGDDGDTREVKLGREFKIGRVYEFRDVPQGAYRLVAEVAGTTMWDLKVQVPGDRETALDLTDGNAVVASTFSPPAD
jgi:outer membrane murein-binding lipoprotein Lpp